MSGYTHLQAGQRVGAAYDFHPTPECATMLLLSEVKFNGIIWEPASGLGSISKILKREGYGVMSSDIQKGKRIHGVGGVDFLETNQRADHIVTNPPYALLTPFLDKALKVVNRKVAFLVNSHALWGKRRAAIFQKDPPSRILVIANSIPYFKAGEWIRGGMMMHAWLVWGDNKGPRISWHVVDSNPTTFDEQIGRTTCKK